ncbi:Cysteine--tRNA ligase [subsurface metagenome]
MQLGEEKMSKSLGNLVPLKETLTRYSADAFRIFVLSSHYRSPLTYSEEGLEAAERGADRLRQTAHGEGEGEKVSEGIDIEAYRNQFTEAMDDDFNTAQAIATLFDLAREINRADEARYEVIGARQTLKELAGVLGLTLELPEKPSLDAKAYSDIVGAISALPPEAKQWQPSENESYIEHLIWLRNQLRADKQWQQADIIRAKLDELGITLEDTPKGTEWKRKR